MTADETRASRPEGPARDATTAPRRALVVAGMHRSGTSAVTRVLALLGAALPRQLMESTEHNPKGYFESQRIFSLHEALLEEAGTAWDDLCAFPRAWLATPEAEGWIARMAEAVREEFGDAPLFAIKDPRACRLVPFWNAVFDRLGVAPAFVIPVRNPIDVAASLRRAEQTPDAKGMLLWLQYFLAAEHDTRGCPRSFVGYDALLEDWRREVARIERDLGFALPRSGPRAHAEVDEFLSAELRHRATSIETLLARRDVPAWVKDAFAWGLRAARDEAPGTDALDAIRTALAPAEASFGPVVGAAELARARSEEELHRSALQIARLEADAEEQGRALAAAREEIALRREEVDRLADRCAELEARAKPLVDWVQSTLQWAGGVVGGGPAAEAHLAFAMREIDAADLRNVPQLANAGIRLAQQAAEASRLAEEADQRKAQASRLARELEAARAALVAKEEALAQRTAELDALSERRRAELGHQLEAARQQVRGLWHQLAARDAELATAREEAGRRVAEAATARAQAVALGAAVESARAQLAAAAAARAATDARAESVEAALFALAAFRPRPAPATRSARLARLLADGTGAAPGEPPASLAQRIGRLLGWAATFGIGTRLRERAAARELAASGLFDAGFYRASHPDVTASGLDPITHYLRHGAAEGRNPSQHFDTRFYLAGAPDVASAGINPLLHFLRTGAAEGRSPCPAFDGAAWLRMHPAARRFGVNPLLHWYALATLQARRLPTPQPVAAQTEPTESLVAGPGATPVEVLHRS
jgi:hypothetical protein